MHFLGLESDDLNYDLAVLEAATVQGSASRNNVKGSRRMAPPRSAFCASEQDNFAPYTHF